MVTSPWDHCGILPRGLVPRLPRLRCQFRGDWSQRITTSTSESDSNTLAGEEMQHHLSYYFFSLTTDMNRDSQNLRVPQAAEQDKVIIPKHSVRGVCPFFFFPAVCHLTHWHLPFVSSQWLLWRKVTNGKCGSSFLYKYIRPLQLQASFCIPWSCSSIRIVSFLICKDDHIYQW